MTPKQRETHRKKRVSEYAESECQAMIEEIEADMAAQLERVREMEGNRGLALTNEPPAPTSHGLASNPTDLQ